MKKNKKIALTAASAALSATLLLAGCDSPYNGDGISLPAVSSPVASVTKSGNLTATADDSKVTLEWTYSSITTAECRLGSTVVEAKTVSGTSVSFYGLDNGTEYDFVLKTKDGTEAGSVSSTPAITVKKSDYLILMYMDGDNNLNDVLYLDMNEVEAGLGSIRNEDGTPKAGYASVNAVALWDGYTNTYVYDSDKKKYVYEEYATLGESGTYLLELGADSHYYNPKSNAEYYEDEDIYLSTNTRNLTYTAKDWIISSDETLS